MKIKKIEFIPGSGVNVIVTKTRTLYDELGNPVVVEERDEPSAMGLNDFTADPRNPTTEELETARQRIREKLEQFMNNSNADLLAENAVISTAYTAEKSAKLSAKLESDALKAELASVRAELESTNPKNQQKI